MKKKIVIMILGVLVLTSAVGIGFHFLRNNDSEQNNTEVSEKTNSSEKSDIFVVENTDGTDDGFSRLVELMKTNGVDFYYTDENDGIISKNDVIIIKVNSQWDQRGGTNVDLVKSVIDEIMLHPEGFQGEIIIADNGQAQYGSAGLGGSLDWKKTNSSDKVLSFHKLAESYNSEQISTYLWDEITLNKVNEFSEGDMDEGFVLAENQDETTKITVSYPKFISKKGTYISFKYGVWNKDKEEYDSGKLKIINIPVLKTHFIYGVTGAVKAYMGVPSDRLTKNSHVTVGIGSMGTLMAETRVPDINIMDAIYINAYTGTGTRVGGPDTPYEKATQINMILASTDPIALDIYAAAEILMPEAKKLTDNIGSKYSLDTSQPGTFGYWLNLAALELTQAGYNVTMDLDNVQVYKK